MQKNDLVFPSTSLLPMKDIATLLEIGYNHVVDDRKNNNAFIPKDTESVGEIPSTQIAISEEDRHVVLGSKTLVREKTKDEIDKEIKKGILEDTVDRYKRLGFDDLISTKDLALIKNIVGNLNSNCGNEIRDLRDELYMLKSYLQKQGIAKQVEPYSGFIDVFRKDNIKYLKSYGSNSLKIAEIEQVVSSEKIIVKSIEEFKKGDYFVIHIKPADESEIKYDKNNKCTGSYDGNYFLEKVVDIDIDDRSITFNQPIEGLSSSNSELLKTTGIYYKGSFSNSLLETNGYTEREFHTSLLDDTHTKQLSITDVCSGYATLIKIPKDNIGSIASLRIKGQSVGTPGDLVCYVVEEEYVPHFTNKTTAINDKKIIAESDFIKAENHINFGDIIFENFKDPEDKHSVILEDKNYCFIIKSLNSNEYGDHWELQFVYHYDPISGGQDIQANHILYKFKEIPFPAANGQQALLTDRIISSYDLYYELITKERVLQKERPLSKGLYTARFSLPYPIEVLRARLTLRINREGLFKTKTQAVTKEDNYIEFKHDDDLTLYTIDSARMLNTDKLIVGSCFTDIKDSKNMKAKISKGICYNQYDPVYRMGYKVQIRGTNNQISKADNKASTEKAELRNIEPLPMELKCIIPDHHANNKVAKEYLTSSDRLIFETSFLKKEEIDKSEKSDDDYKESKIRELIEASKVNEFEVQIAWESSYDIGELMKYEELTGRIFDLSLSLDRNY